MEIWFILLVVLLGFAGGFMAGMLGVGGGLVFIPVFQEIVRNHLTESDKVSYVLANSLLIVFVVGISGSVKQYRLKNTHLPSALSTGISAIVSSLGLSFALQHFRITDPKLFNGIFAVILLLTALRMWTGRKQTRLEEKQELHIPPTAKFIPAGLVAGLITAITGLGGGIIMIPYFNKILKLPIKFATGLSLSVIPIIAFPLLLFYIFHSPEGELFPGWQTGHILWPAVIPMVIAAGIGSPFGVKFAQRLKPQTILFVYIAFIVVNMVKMLVQF